jgi:alpha-tubulin suppressor-like RCC1 family protein
VALLAAALTAAAAVTGCSGGAEGTTSPDLATMAPSTTAPLLQWVAPVPPFGTPSNAGSYTLVALVTGTASATFTVQNNGDRASGALAVSLTATGAAAYTITSNTCSGVSLGKGKGCSVAVQFAPTTAGAASAVLSVTSKKLDAQATVTLTGAALRRATLVGGDRHTCGLTSAGAAYCWGDNSYGQLGTTTNTGTDTPNPTPTAVSVPSGVTFVSLEAGVYHTCGLTSAGAAYCWGDSGNGQLGNGTTTGSSAPVAVSAPEGVTFAGLAAGSYHNCGVTSAGAAYCWGFNGYGQLGDGTTTSRATPTAVTAGLTFATP